MPPRVTYWTGTWDPAKEATSKEINALRTGARAHAPVVSFSPGQRTALMQRERVLKISGRGWLALRGVAAVVERRGDITHIFGGHVSWHLFRALGRRPILLTAVAVRVGAERLPHTNIARVAIEAETSRAEWLDAGIPRERIAFIPPGIDLDWFQPLPPPCEGKPAGRFALLFASTPSDPAELEPRGVPLLVELARARPDIDLIVPWRQWGDVSAAAREIERLQPPANFLITHGDAPDMRTQYARAHATIACFARGGGKASPNFVLEGLACGRPCLVTPDVGISNAVAISGAGLVSDRDVASLSAAVDRLRSEWPAFSRRSRQFAEDQFGIRQFQARYDRLYDDILAESGRS